MQTSYINVSLGFQTVSVLLINSWLNIFGQSIIAILISISLSIDLFVCFFCRERLGKKDPQALWYEMRQILVYLFFYNICRRHTKYCKYFQPKKMFLKNSSGKQFPRFAVTFQRDLSGIANWFFCNFPGSILRLCTFEVPSSCFKSL